MRLAEVDLCRQIRLEDGSLLASRRGGAAELLLGVVCKGAPVVMAIVSRQWDTARARETARGLVTHAPTPAPSAPSRGRQ